MAGFYLFSAVNSGREKFFWGGLFALMGVALCWRNWIYTPSAIVALGWFATSLGICCWRQKRYRGDYAVVVFPYLIFSLLSLFYSETANTGWPEITLETAMLGLLVFIPRLPLPDWKSLVTPLIVIQFLFAVYQFYGGDSPRAVGTFLNWSRTADIYPNALALFSVLIIPIFWGAKTNRARNGILLFMAFSTLFLSYSRGGTLALFLPLAGLSLWQLYQGEKSHLVRNIFCLLLAAGLFWGMNQLRFSKGLPTANLAEKLIFEGDEKITSVNERSQFWQQSLILLAKAPVWGYGPGSFPYIFPARQEIPLSNSSHPHNWVLKVAVERGWLALTAFLVLIFFIFRHGLNDFSRKIPYLAALTAGFLHNSIDFNLNFPLNYWLLILIGGIILTDRQDQKSHVSPAPARIFSALILVLIVTVTGVLTWKHAAYARGNNSTDPQVQSSAFADLNYGDAALKRADILSAANDSQAETVLRRHLDLNRHDSLAWTRLGQWHFIQGEGEKAILALEKSIAVNPLNFVESYLWLAKTLNRFAPEKIKTSEDRFYFFLKSYLRAAMNNLHHTAEGEQVEQAAQLSAELLKNPYLKDKEGVQQIKKDLEAAKKKWRKTI